MRESSSASSVSCRASVVALSHLSTAEAGSEQPLHAPLPPSVIGLWSSGRHIGLQTEMTWPHSLNTDRVRQHCASQWKVEGRNGWFYPSRPEKDESSALDIFLSTLLSCRCDGGCESIHLGPGGGRPGLRVADCSIMPLTTSSQSVTVVVPNSVLRQRQKHEASPMQAESGHK